MSNILAHVLNQRVVCLERCVESLAVCMPHTLMDKQCSNFNTRDLSLNGERQRVRCAWAFTVVCYIDHPLISQGHNYTHHTIVLIQLEGRPVVEFPIGVERHFGNRIYLVQTRGSE